MNILVTGYNGFVGKNLVYSLRKNKKLNITFGKENSFEDLELFIKKSDIIFHLAGENRNNFKRVL